MKVCIIGNSHVACMRAAHEASTLPPDTTLDFFALPGGHQPQLELRDGRFYPAGAVGRLITTVPLADVEGLSLADYDAVIVSGAGRLVVQNKTVEETPAKHPLGVALLCDWSWTPDMSAPKPRIVSRAVFAAIMDAFVKSHGSVTLLHNLHQHYNGRVIVQPCPAPSRSVHMDQSWFINRWYGSQGEQVWADYFRAYWATLKRIVDELGARFHFLDHPEQAICWGAYTDEYYCTPDRWHGNARYGQCLLQASIATLRNQPCISAH